MTEQPARQVPVAAHTRTVGGPAEGTAPGPSGEPGAAPAQAGGGSWMSQRSLGGLPNWAWIALAAGIAVAGILYMRSRNAASQAAAQQQQAAQPASTMATQGQCYDSSGNTVPCSQADYASQIAALQAEIDNMNGQASVPTSPPTTTTGTTGTTQPVPVNTAPITATTTSPQSASPAAGTPAG